jgi:uncharacterized protein (DUF1697 family)
VTQRRHIALLRAINVGGHTVKMDLLRELFESLGFSGVETFIASGNVIFETRERNAALLESRIEEHLNDALGYAVITFVRSRDELAAVARSVPFPMMSRDDLLYVAFLKAAPGAVQQEKLLSLRGTHDDFVVCGREAYWLRRGAPGESKFTAAALEKALAMPATMRNVTTVNRLVAKYCSDEDTAEALR